MLHKNTQNTRKTATSQQGLLDCFQDYVGSRQGRRMHAYRFSVIEKCRSDMFQSDAENIVQQTHNISRLDESDSIREVHSRGEKFTFYRINKQSLNALKTSITPPKTFPPFRNTPPHLPSATSPPTPSRCPNAPFHAPTRQACTPYPDL
jgi:hypothetical protein